MRRAVRPWGIVVAVATCAVAAPGCVPASERIDHRPPPTTAVGAAEQSADANAARPGTTAGAANTPAPIRPPTSAIAQPETNPEPESPVALAAGGPDRPAVEPPVNEGPGEPMQEPTGDVALPAAEPSPNAQPQPQEPTPPAATPNAQPRPEFAPDDKPDAAPPQVAEPEAKPEEAPPAEPPLHAAWAQGSAYNALFKPDDLVTLTGDIEAVGTFVPAEEAQPGLLLNVKVGDETIAIHGAPLRYLRSIEVRFDFGERLSIEGSWATIDGKRVLLAQAITRGETRVEIRDAETGRPAWVPAPTPNPAPGEGIVEGDNDRPPATVPTG